MIGTVKKWFEQRKQRSEVVSIVALQSFPKLLTSETIQAALTNLGIQATLAEERTSYFRTTIDGFELTIGSLPIPYPAFVGQKTTEIRISEACAKHTSFMMVDAWNAPEGKQRTDARPLIAKIISALSDEYVLAFYDWTSHRFFLPDKEILDDMAEGNIDAAIAKVGDMVIGINSADDRLERAVEEARSRWPEFVEAFHEKYTDFPFTAKGRFEHNEEVEHLWIEVEACDLQSVTGKVINKPYHIPRPRFGDVVTIPLDELSDWLYKSKDGRPVGCFIEQMMEKGEFE